MFSGFANWASQSFRHPWFMLLGILLISVPIIIHLINRIRFKRIRWAAMEFLLKSQKRNRRRLILEQLLLLALRCFLVLLAGLLVARFVNQAIDRFGAQDTWHFVVIDNTLSMNDRWQDEANGKDMTSFDMGKAFVRAIAKTALDEDTPQHMRVILLSDPENPLFDGQLNADSKRELEVKLDSHDLEAGLRHIKPEEAFAAASKYFEQHSEGKKAFHLVSDFRDKDWNSSDPNLNAAMDKITQVRNANVFLMDCGEPFRKENQQVVLNHDNVCISSFQPETRIVSNEGQPIEFTVTIENHSPSERKNVMLTVYVDGDERFEATQPIPNIPVGQSEFKVQLGFTKEGPNHVTAKLEEEKKGLNQDNVRHAVVEVRKRIPVLVVDGGYPDVDGDYSDTRFVRTALGAARGYEVVPKPAEVLEKEDLSLYPSIFLLNVAANKISEKGLKNLEEYVNRGGRIAFFLGDRVQGAEYNKTLYNGGAGLFPVPLEAKSTEKLNKEDREDLAGNGTYFKIFLRQPNHPVLRGLASVTEVLRYLLIDQYIPAQPRYQWSNPAAVEELITLPSRKDMKNFEVPAQDLNKKLEALAADEKFAKYKPGLERHRDSIRKVLAGGGKYLHELASALDALLTDRGDPEKKDVRRPNLVEFWELPDQAELKTNFEQLRDAVMYGDPLVVAKRFGKGQVVACLTSASTRWNEWAGGSIASFTFPMLVTDLQKYLTGGNEESNRMLGTPVVFTLDAERYEPRMHRRFLSGLPDNRRDKAKDDKSGPGQDLGEQKVEVKDKKIVFEFNEAKKDGLYEFLLYPRGEPTPPPETRVYVYNVDTENESNLQRAGRDKLERGPAGTGAEQVKVKLLVGDSKLLQGDASLSEVLSEKKSDFSETPWIYLIFIAVLVVEQMLAVHLSFHIRGSSEAQLPGQVLKSQGIAS
jgi:hypothetical protein